MTHFRKIHPLYCRCGDTNFTKNQRILNSLYLCISHIESHVIVAPQKKMIMRSLAIGRGKKMLFETESPPNFIYSNEGIGKYRENL